MTTARLTGRLGLSLKPRLRPNLRLPSRRSAVRQIVLIGAAGLYGLFALVAGVGVTALLLLLSHSTRARAAARPDEVQGQAIVVSPSILSRTQADIFHALRSQVPAAVPAPPPQAPTVPGAAEDGTLIGQHITAGQVDSVNITFYDCLDQGFCGAMYNGTKVYQGAAACSWNLPLGTRFQIKGDPTGRVYTCADRGLLPNTWVDIFWNDPADGWKWQRSVGRFGTIVIVN
jgi:hypothetical protein